MLSRCDRFGELISSDVRTFDEQVKLASGRQSRTCSRMSHGNVHGKVVRVGAGPGNRWQPEKRSREGSSRFSTRI